MSLRIVAGQFKGRLLKAPKGSSTRPTQGMLRESVFNICQNEIHGARFLDLFAGSGAMGLEAISRGAKHATFVEKDRRAASLIRENVALLQTGSQTTILCCDANAALRRVLGPFDLIYVDPPYDIPAAPFVQEILERKLLAPNGMLFIEERSRSNPKSPEFSQLECLGLRKFGEALLHQYRHSATLRT